MLLTDFGVSVCLMFYTSVPFHPVGNTNSAFYHSSLLIVSGVSLEETIRLEFIAFTVQQREGEMEGPSGHTKGKTHTIHTHKSLQPSGIRWWLYLPLPQLVLLYDPLYSHCHSAQHFSLKVPHVGH